MKKLGVLVALVLCVTIGGVYAAWAYTGNTVATLERTVSKGMTTATQDGDVGVLNIESNTIDLAIDQTAEGNYLAKMVVTGSVKVHFTPNPGAPDEVVENAVPVKASIVIGHANENLYDGHPIFVNTEVASVPLQWVYEEGAHHAYITADDVASLIQLGSNFVLPTHEDYTNFKNTMANVTLTLVISMDGAAIPTPQK